KIQLRKAVRPNGTASGVIRAIAAGYVMRASGHNSRFTPAKLPAWAHTRSADARSGLAIVKEYTLFPHLRRGSRVEVQPSSIVVSGDPDLSGRSVLVVRLRPAEPLVAAANLGY